jgi:hypothetical protein
MSAKHPDPPGHVAENIETILAFYKREEAEVSASRRVLEHVGIALGRPASIALTLAFVAAWIAAQLLWLASIRRRSSGCRAS